MQEKPIYFYMANLWSEIEKIFIGKERGDEEMIRSALSRATPIIKKLETFDNNNANKEIHILKEVVRDIGGKKTCKINRAEISSYFSPFAMRVMFSQLKKS